MDVKNLIAEVAKRHNVLLSEQDPVFAVVSLNEILLEDYVKKLNAALEKALRETNTASALRTEETKRAMAQLIATAGNWLREQVTAGGSSICKDMESLTRETRAAAIAAKESRAASEAAASAAAKSQRKAIWALVASVVILIFAAVLSLTAHRGAAAEHQTGSSPAAAVE